VAAFGVEQIQNGGRCHGNQGAFFISSLQTSKNNSGCITSPHYFGTSVSMVMPF
jgi:hypothetical protein